MDNSDQDYLTDYRLFFDNFYESLELDNPLPVHIGKYNVAEFEIAGEIVSWCLEYLNSRKCPPSLIAPLCRSTMIELEDFIRKYPESCGYRPEEDDYQALKLMQVTIKKLCEVCLRYRDNSEVSRLPPPPPVTPSVSAAAVKNGRRTMEDCHIIIHDLHALFGIEGYGVASYYAVFDGHIGSDAAIYSCSHIYQYLVESRFYPANPEAAFKEAFIKTDERFIDKSHKNKEKSGTTAVCILIRHDLGKMYVAWLGDSQAILVNGRDYIQLVNPHRPEQVAEKERIEALGGSVVYWGTWRVNGQLAVSRAIGDIDYKPYITAEPDVTSYELTGDEDFLLLACDGLWDVVSEKDVVDEVYNCLEQNKGDRSSVALSLVNAAKSLGSKDNISVVVAWLDMSTLENGHFVSEPDSAEDILLPPVLRSIKPAVQAAATPAPHRLDENAERWLKTLPWSYADALRKPAPKKEEPKVKPPVIEELIKEAAPIDPVEVVGVPKEDDKPDGKQEKLADMKVQPDVVKEEESRKIESLPKGEETGDVAGDGESGEDSDEEWNYISGKENNPPNQANQHNNQELSEEDMESQLNPNAAEFVPVYGSSIPNTDIDITDISHSPTKRSEIRNLDNVAIPTKKDFFDEVSKRPSEIDDFNESTLNGGDLNDLSTKAVFGDDSVHLNATEDSSLIQNDVSKDTNPFSSSQLPNFVQHHFSSPDLDFKPFSESQNDTDLDFMSSNAKPDLISPSEPTQEISSTNTNNDLSGITFGDVVNVDEIVRSKQDSPLLRESPEPGLHNGRIGSPQLETVNPVSSLSPAPSPIPANVLPPSAAEKLAEAIETPAFTSDQGPETCVDSESDDDLVCPRVEKSAIEFEEKITQQLVDEALKVETSSEQDSTFGFNSDSVDDVLKKPIDLLKDNLSEKVDEHSEDLICPLKPTTSDVNAFVAETFKNNVEHAFDPFHSEHDKPDEIAFDSESKHEVHLDNEVCEIQHKTLPKEEFVIDQISHQNVVEEVCSKKEVQEDLICPMKESPLEKDFFEKEGAFENEIHNFQVNAEFHKSDSHDNEEPILNQDSGINNPFMDDSVCMLPKEEPVAKDESVENMGVEDLVCTLKTNEEISSFNEDDLICKMKKDALSSLDDQVEREPTKMNNDINQQQEHDDLLDKYKENDLVLNHEVSFSNTEDLACPIKKKDICSSKPTEINIIEGITDGVSHNEEMNASHAIDEQEKAVEDTIQQEISSTNLESPQISENDKEVCSLKKEPVETEDMVCPIKTDSISDNNFQQEESLDEMSSSMIDHGEEKGLPEAQSNQLNLVQELQFEVQEKTEADTESDSGFEIINASEASTIEMEMRIQSEKEAGAIDEKLLLDKNEAELNEKLDDLSPQENHIEHLERKFAEALDEKSVEPLETQADEPLETKSVEPLEAQSVESPIEKPLESLETKSVEPLETKSVEPSETKSIEPLETKSVEPLVTDAIMNGGTVTPPATPPATPAPGLHEENKEGLLAAAVAAAGVATVAAAGSAAVAVNDSKADDKKKAPIAKKEAPAKAGVTAKPTAAAKTTTKPAAPVPGKAAPGRPAPATKTATKPPSPATKVASTSSARPGSASKPSTPTTTTKVAAKPASKPSTPTAAKPATASTTLKSKPATTTSAAPKSTATAKPPAASKPSAPSTAAKKPASSVTSSAKPAGAPAKPPTATAKPAAAKPADKSSTTAAKPASSTAPKSPVTKTVTKALATSSVGSKTSTTARPPSAKSTVPSKTVSSTTAKAAPARPAAAAPAKAAPAATKATAAKPASTTAAKTAPAAKAAAPAAKGAPAKTAAAPINKKPAAPTAIKKPPAPTDKSVKEANNKLASSKTAVKKIEDSKIVSKADVIEEPLTQEPIISTTNGHISLIENGIPTPEIVAEAN